MLRDELPQWGAGRKIGPSLVLTPQQLSSAVENILQRDAFVIDVETTFADHPSLNDVLWVGLASYGACYLIPIMHPNGSLISRGETLRVPDMSTVRPFANNPNKFTKPKLMNEYVEPVYTAAPQQMRADVVFRLLKPLLFSSLLKIGHNLKFDMMSVAKYYGETPPGPYADTLIMAHILDEHKNDYGLKSLVTRRYLGLKAQNPRVREKYYPNLGKAGVWDFSIESAAAYLAKDVTYTFLFWKAMMRDIKSQGFAKALEVDMALYPAIMSMENRGVFIDQSLLEVEHAKILSQLQETRMDVWRICGEQFPLTVVSKKIHYMFSSKDVGGQGLTPKVFTEKTGKPKLDANVLLSFAGNPLADLLLTFSQIDKQRQFCEQLVMDKTIKGRIHASFNQHRTDTGRLSASNPNLQQIPRGETFRQVFAPEPGSVFVVADYDQVELRVIAHLAQEEGLIELFLSGQDIHAAAASRVLGIPIEEVTPLLRQIGKGINFMVVFGGSAIRLAGMTGLSEKACDIHIENYYQEFHGLRPWKVKVVKEAVARGDRSDPRFPPLAAIQPFGRVRRLPDLFSSVPKFQAKAQRQAVNCAVQGFAAYIMKLAMTDLHVALLGIPGAGVVLNVHDEVVVECLAEDQDAVKALVEVAMQGVSLDGKPILGRVPLIASAGIGSSWYEGKG